MIASINWSTLATARSGGAGPPAAGTLSAGVAPPHAAAAHPSTRANDDKMEERARLMMYVEGEAGKS